MQLRLLSIFLLMILALGPTACAGPYSNAPDKLARPHLDDDDDDEGDDDDDDEEAEQDKDKDKDKDKAKDVCRTNFFAEPFTGRRDQRRARALSRKTDPVLLKADSTESPEERVPLIVSAVKTLSDALEADPYGPEPTYKLAVAYALGNRKACSLRVLERLAALKAMPDVEREASRIIKRASRDVAFAAFRDEANTALGN
ncbi:MAG TPA: hypothetical protein VFG83_03420 [Kofleriaceae bacterium]|nr:hypothetical protein [Kofleriaceae bacterium]